MSDLRNQIIRLAHANPDLRPKLLPLVAAKTPDVSGYKKLKALVDKGTVKFEGSDIVGKASDGRWVSLGDTSNLAGAEGYLRHHPHPSDW